VKIFNNSWSPCNGIKWTTSTPYHPSTNGLAERAVQIIKKGLKKTKECLIKSNLARILLAYQTAPHSTTSNALAKLFLGQNLCTTQPNTAENVESKQWNSIPSHPFTDGQSVLVCVYGHNHELTHDTILNKSTGPLSHTVKLLNGTNTKINSIAVENT